VPYCPVDRRRSEGRDAERRQTADTNTPPPVIAVVVDPRRPSCHYGILRTGLDMRKTEMEGAGLKLILFDSMRQIAAR